MFTFLDMKGNTLFVRDDAERASWTQEEMTLDLEFPRLEDKIISIGQRIFFKDPSTGDHQIYEVKQARTLEPDHYQTVTAEHICISELTDEFTDNAEIDDLTAKAALQQVLQGTLWSVGNVAVNPVSSGDITRGSVWQAVLEITTNWNVYIVPRVTLGADGTITRKLDILSTDGVWNGLRLSVDKNMLDPSVIFDDSEVVTALYGFGGTTTPTKKGEEEKEITFADLAWQKTSEHPAKPKGQTYLEDPTATAEYGRNGRPRFGFYQNTDIEDPEILLEKTWETLKRDSKPDISVEGTVADLYRLGYADTPIKLHDIALVEVLPAGYKERIQIIRMTTDLLDPSATTLTIGAYIPNIVYIERQTNEEATGGRGGGGGNKSKQTVRSEYETALLKNNRMIMMRAYQNDVDDMDNEIKRQDAKITVEAGRITQEVSARKDVDEWIIEDYGSKITQLATSVSIEIENATETSKIVAGINSQTGSYVQIQARTINLTGYTTITKFNALSGTVDGILSAGTFGSNKITSAQINATSLLAASNGFNFKGHTIGSYACTTNGGATFYALGWG